LKGCRHVREPSRASAQSRRRQTSGKAPTDAFAEFLNPNSMITPGAAGAITMVITNTLCQQFAQLPLNYTGWRSALCSAPWFSGMARG